MCKRLICNLYFIVNVYPVNTAHLAINKSICYLIALQLLNNRRRKNKQIDDLHTFSAHNDVNIFLSDKQPLWHGRSQMLLLLLLLSNNMFVY